MGFKIEENTSVMLVDVEGNQKRAKLTRPIYFRDGDLRCSPLPTHNQNGIFQSPYIEYKWAFDISQKAWEDNKFIKMYVERVLCEISTDKYEAIGDAV